MADTWPCRSDYYADTGRRREHGSRLILCSLVRDHTCDHEELDTRGEVMHAWAWAPEPPPRTWELPPEPGPEVTAVRHVEPDILGRPAVYDRERWGWRNRRTGGVLMPWHLILAAGKLVDATHDAEETNHG